MGVIGIFGANGFIGRALVRDLLRRRCDVVALGRAFPPNYQDLVGEVETRIVDITDVLTVQATLCGIDRIVNLVNSSSPALGNERAMEDAAANVLPQISFVQSCILSHVSRIVFLSSGGTVYGAPAYTPLDEAHPTNPLVSYGMTKLVAEQYLRMLTRDRSPDHVILRVSNPFGPGQVLHKGQGLVPAILARHAAGLPILVYGDGKAERDYLYIDDLCEAVAAALDAPPMRETFNIGTGQGRSVLEVIRALEVALGQTLPIQYVEGRPTDARSNVLDCRKAAQLLGWSPATSFEEGIRRTVAAASV